LGLEGGGRCGCYCSWTGPRCPCCPCHGVGVPSSSYNKMCLLSGSAKKEKYKSKWTRIGANHFKQQADNDSRFGTNGACMTNLPPAPQHSLPPNLLLPRRSSSFELELPMPRVIHTAARRRSFHRVAAPSPVSPSLWYLSCIALHHVAWVLTPYATAENEN